jgi:hypothetical protein
VQLPALIASAARYGASNAMLDFLAPMPSPNANDGPSALARARREWLERELARSKEVSPGREGKSGGKDG